MAIFLLDPASLDVVVCDEPFGELPELEVSDCTDDYCTSEGAGLWIPVFLKFVERKVQALGRDPKFSFSEDENLCSETLDEIKSPYIRSLVIRFCNEHYTEWRDCDVHLPDYDGIREDCRTYCDDCDNGWRSIFGEYDGPLPEDVEADEDEDEPDIEDAERQARITRNRDRQRERHRREQAQEDAESEEVDREFVCDEDCDGFCDRVHEAYRDAFSVGNEELEARWILFQSKGGKGCFPPLQPF